MVHKGSSILFFSLLISSFLAPIHGKKRTEALGLLYKSKLTKKSAVDTSGFEVIRHDRVEVLPQDGMKERDRIEKLPGQPNVEFSHYGGYVTVNESTGKAFYYYFVEAQKSHHLPLLLWLNGGPGCSSLAYGAMQELGPFRVHSDGKTLYKNRFSWNHGAIKSQIVSIWGFALTLIEIGNALINDNTDRVGRYDYLASHAIISDKTLYQIKKYCNVGINATPRWSSDECMAIAKEAREDLENIDIYNIYAPLCHNATLTQKPKKTSMKLPVKTAWHPWLLNGEVGGYTEVYKGDLTFATVRGAGHQVPSYQPARALSLIMHFLAGTPLPNTSRHD
ncbi:serine carboxypeptidase-like 39 [Actinidia rufa]|uniref:Serine carboxypeptidase-like 39 n=1 Tax=Actinidia rufa TaxID=165716 RepID=A0A7J0FVC7_9ERIC|nr:serine carboxypeptidase-like 39 [Actinidia rufa]